MARHVLDIDNFDRVIAEIKTSAEKLFDFSGTNFKTLGAGRLSHIFIVLSSLPQPFSLKLNHCKMDEEQNGRHSQLEALTLGLSTTKNMERFEFVCSLSPDCPESVLITIAGSLLRNHEIKNIRLDGDKVIPSTVCDLLKNHPTAQSVFVNGLSKLNRSNCRQQFFKPAANDPLSHDGESPAIRRKKQR